MREKNQKTSKVVDGEEMKRMAARGGLQEVWSARAISIAFSVSAAS